MSENSGSFDPVWETAYANGFSQRWPWDAVVTFVFRHAPKDRARNACKILELGFGSGSNLWFAAREGFTVAGIEGSQTAVDQARHRFDEEGLRGDLRQGDFTKPLPFPDNTFDLVIDRASLTYAGFSKARGVIEEVARVTVAGGAALFAPYASDHPAASSGYDAGDGLVDGLSQTRLAGLGPTSFWSESDVRSAFGAGWELRSLAHLGLRDLIDPSHSYSAWHAVAYRR